MSSDILTGVDFENLPIGLHISAKHLDQKNASVTSHNQQTVCIELDKTNYCGNIINPWNFVYDIVTVFIFVVIKQSFSCQ